MEETAEKLRAEKEKQDEAPRVPLEKLTQEEVHEEAKENVTQPKDGSR